MYPRNSQVEGTSKSNIFLLALLETLFCTPTLKMLALPLILTLDLPVRVSQRSKSKPLGKTRVVFYRTDAFPDVLVQCQSSQGK